MWYTSYYYCCKTGNIMGKTRHYFCESKKTGKFSYRRRVPNHLVPVLKKREFKFSYHTSNKAAAFREHDRIHRQVEKEIHEAETLLKSIPTAQEPKSKTPSKLFQEVYSSLNAKGYLPHQMASSNVTMSEEERMAWAADDLAWSEATLAYDADAIDWPEYKQRMDSLNLTPAFKKFAEHRDYIRYLEMEAELDRLPDKGQMALKILKGDYTSPDPSIEDVFNLYRDFSRTKVANNERSPTQQKKVEQDTERLAKLVYSAHPNGKATLIEDLDETAIDEAFTAQYARTDTRKRNYTQMSAAVQLWNKKKPKQKIDDPFLSLKLELPSDDKDKKPRRVWRPEEFQYFWESIQDEPRPSVKIMGLLMAYGGKPQGETAALRRNNVVLSHEVPHIYFEYAIKGKSRQKHFLPLVGLMLEAVTDYIENNFTGGQDDLLFPELHRMDSGSRSKSLNKHRKDMYPIDGFLFSNYGLRHTFKPRYEEAGVSPLNGMYLFGHKNDDTSATHQNYAKDLAKTGSEFRQLKDDMEKVMAVKSWTYSYRISDFD
jgi:integrase